MRGYKTPRSFEKLYHKFALPLMKFVVKRMGGKTTAAEEVFEETMIAAWKGYNAFEHKSKFFTWLCRIAINKTADYYRTQINYKSRFIAPGLEDLANMQDKNLTPEEKASLDELRFCVKDCLDLLPTEKRNLLYLRYWKDMTIKGISEMFGVSERSAEGKIYRAKLAFREVYLSRFTK